MNFQEHGFITDPSLGELMFPAIEAVTMSFKMPTGKKLDSMLDKLSAKDIKEIRAQFELDVQKENQKF